MTDKELLVSLYNEIYTTMHAALRHLATVDDVATHTAVLRALAFTTVPTVSDRENVIAMIAEIRAALLPAAMPSIQQLLDFATECENELKTT